MRHWNNDESSAGDLAQSRMAQLWINTCASIFPGCFYVLEKRTNTQKTRRRSASNQEQHTSVRLGNEISEQRHARIDFCAARLSISRWSATANVCSAILFAWYAMARKQGVQNFTGATRETNPKLVLLRAWGLAYCDDAAAWWGRWENDLAARTTKLWAF
jgi:hypothetical protein